MQKIIPILLIICSVLIIFLAACALICACLALGFNEPLLGLISAPFAIITLVLSFGCGGLSFMFKKSRICFAAFIISAIGFLIALAAVIIIFV